MLLLLLLLFIRAGSQQLHERQSHERDEIFDIMRGLLDQARQATVESVNQSRDLFPLPSPPPSPTTQGTGSSPVPAPVQVAGSPRSLDARWAGRGPLRCPWLPLGVLVARISGHGCPAGLPLTPGHGCLVASCLAQSRGALLPTAQARVPVAHVSGHGCPAAA
ncbi:hypothetical protein GGR52DRAFT_64142 [Hypoxylon sp. FL1284]|nr:hypothetical protein GGR52DRAFT_64142 [Hypoxylon sp. FL1284]